MKRENYGFLCLINTVILFSTFEVISKTLVGKINPFQINFIRFLVGGIVLLVFVIIKGGSRITVKDFLWVSLIGVINVVISMNLLQLSLFDSTAKASVVAVIFSSNPIFVTIFAGLFDREEIGLVKVLGLIVGFIGIIVIFFDKIGFQSMDIRSPLLALLSAIFYGLYTVLGRKISINIGSLKMNAYSFIIGSLVLLPVLICLKTPIIHFDYSGIIQVGYLSVFVSGFAYLTYFKGLAILGASRGSLVFFIKPVLASVIAILFLKEQASINLLIGTILILSGIFISVKLTNTKKSQQGLTKCREL